MSFDLPLPAGEIAQVDPWVVDFFDRFGQDALDIYTAGGLYHVTHSVNEAGIDANGLRPTEETITDEEGAFVLAMFHRYGDGHPNNLQMINSHILGKSADTEQVRGVHLSTHEPDLDEEYVGYGVPERIIFLMRSMHALSRAGRVVVDDREFAASTFDRYRQWLTEGDARLIAYKVNPLAPAVLNARLGQWDLEGADLSAALHVARHPDGAWGSNIHVPEPIGAQYLSKTAQTPFTEEDLIRRGVQSKTGWIY